MTQFKYDLKLLFSCYLFISLLYSTVYATVDETGTSFNDTPLSIAASTKSVLDLLQTNIPKIVTPNNVDNSEYPVFSEGEPEKKNSVKRVLKDDDSKSTPEMPKPVIEPDSSTVSLHINTNKNTSLKKLDDKIDNKTIMYNYNSTVPILNTAKILLPDEKNDKNLTIVSNTTVAAATIASSISTSNTTTKTSRISTTSASSTTSTTSTPRPMKPTLTHSVDEDPDAYKVKENIAKTNNNNTNNNTNSNTTSNEKTAESSARNKTTGHAEYVVPVVITIFAVPLFVSLTVYCVRQGRDYWEKRHYRRMDFLIDGMYNE